MRSLVSKPLANGIARVTNLDAQEVLNDVLHVMARRTRRDGYALENNGLEHSVLKSVLEEVLKKMGLPYELKITGKWSWSQEGTDIQEESLNLGPSERGFILGFIKTAHFGVFFKDGEVSEQSKKLHRSTWRAIQNDFDRSPTRKHLTLEAVSRDFSPIGRNGSGHIVLIDELFDLNGQKFVRFINPAKRKPEEIGLHPITFQRGGFEGLLLSIYNLSFGTPYQTKTGASRQLVQGTAKALTSVWKVVF